MEEQIRMEFLNVLTLQRRSVRELVMQHVPAQFENQAIRRAFDEPTETWWFSVVDIMQVLTQQPDFQAAANTGTSSRRA